MNRNRLLWIIGAVIVLAIGVFFKPACAGEPAPRPSVYDVNFDPELPTLSMRNAVSAPPTWEPARWWLETDETSAVVGDTLLVRVMWDVPNISIAEFYRAGIQWDSTIVEYAGYETGPDASDCLLMLTINDTGYMEWDLIWLDGGIDCTTHWDGHVATIKLVTIARGATNVMLYDRLLEEDPRGGYNMNNIFPTREYDTQVDSLGVRHCDDAPWAYAPMPQHFNGIDSNHPCVALLELGPPLFFVSGTITVSVESLYELPWGTIKSMYK